MDKHLMEIHFQQFPCHDRQLASRPHFVYFLLDPRDARIRWVGCTVRPLRRKRLWRWQGSSSAKVDAWIQELRSLELRPKFVPVCVLQGVVEGHRVESELIRRLSIRGEPLLNTLGVPRPPCIKERKGPFHPPRHIRIGKEPKTKRMHEIWETSRKRREDMLVLYNTERLSLTEIGKRYGVTTERIRKILLNPTPRRKKGTS